MNTKLTPAHARPASGRAHAPARDLAGHRRGWRQTVASVAAAALTVGGALVAIGAGASSANGAAPTIVSAVDFEDGTTGTWSQSGGPTLAVVDSPDGTADGKVLSITRKADYEGIQSPVGLFKPGTTYGFSMRARLAAGGPASSDIRFVAKPNYNWIGNATVNAAGWTTVSGTWTAPAAADADPATLQIYLGTSNLADSSAYTILVDDIEITGPPAPSGEAETVIDTDFENGSAQGWTLRDTATTGAALAVVDGGANGTAHALQVSGRDNQGDGPQYSVAGKLAAGTTYHFDGWLRFADGQEPGDLTLSAHTVNGTAENFSNLLAITGVTNAWTHVSGDVTLPAFDGAAEMYVETKWASGDAGNISTFLIDEVKVTKPGASPIQTDIPSLKDTVPFPVGVAAGSAETTGVRSQLVLKDFNQLSPENAMKPEGWYDASHNFRMSSETSALMDFAQANHLRVHGHTLLWHNQTPAWFFQHDDGTALTNSAADQAFLTQRLHDHIFNVAKTLSDKYGLFGSSTNPMVSFDVVNEVIADNATPDGLRQSNWYNILGPNFINLAFQYANQAFDQQYAAPGTNRPITLIINDYGTESIDKQNRLFTEVKSLRDQGVPVDGVGHQFHVSITTPVSSMKAALDRFSTLGVKQAVSELDVSVGDNASSALIIQQGYFYKDVYNLFRAHQAQYGDIFAVTQWNLDDAHSWLTGKAATLFDGNLQAKPAYFGAINGDLPALQQQANVFGGDVAADASGFGDVAWKNLPQAKLSHQAGSFVMRWNADHLTALVTATGAADSVQVQYGTQTATVTRGGSVSGYAGAVAVTKEQSDGTWRAIVHLPHSGVVAGASGKADVRALASGAVVGSWNSAGTTGAVTFLENLSYTEVAQADVAPTIDGKVDPVWATAGTVSTDTVQSGDPNGATAKVRTLWSGDRLYVLAQVTDPTIDVSSSNPWEQDSIEMFVDEGNQKNGAYTAGDAQMRINVDNVRTFGSGDAALQNARVTSATSRTATGYIVEAAVTLEGKGGVGTFQGLDFQLNDGTGGSRTSVHSWAEPTGTGYQTTARWGVGQLVPFPTAPMSAAQLTNAVRGNLAVPGFIPAGGQALLRGLPVNTPVTAWVYTADHAVRTVGTTDASGAIKALVPAGLTSGTTTKVAVFDAHGTLLGWNQARVS
ncbi:endo-1,4-beta-xylanase [Xylanimonas sp. McL0601]|uniref:endo-1,4-beta-xylanase n=1 Tax=Xylanimonas sp. McL0601 TaxID=3414739 RepID=UPI003CF68027